ncbi:hypothetical protein THMIRHAS_07940 [Thiosulfatimonas sediminis]|uniref:CN hydrolase domain-containing protein n=2 Tax=Thiosulfatimonas sediminis TaxID=2675054 RepID=A0A6F8PTG7_9GAMM|nr:hypothetical protein THMIRHAS_07940 [Thiosulfatimonas sediminis]
MQPQQFVESYSVVSFLQDLAVQRNESIIAGVAEKHDTAFQNNALAVNPYGQILLRYQKQRCFTYAGEQEVYQAGKQAGIVEVAGVKTALFVCYDLRFPELFRAPAQQIEMMVVLANWPQERQAHWSALLQARAIENQCFVIGVNRIGEDGNGLHYAGGSMVINPDGVVITKLANESIAQVIIDLDEVAQQRQKFDFLADY